MRNYLLLDDNQAFAENLAEILRDGGDEATVVTDGRRALELARSRRFDVLLTDMKMPGMSGAAAVHHIRQVDPGLAAVVITAYPGYVKVHHRLLVPPPSSATDARAGDPPPVPPRAAHPRCR
jgi:CheY-like chemotaxis protein